MTPPPRTTPGAARTTRGGALVVALLALAANAVVTQNGFVFDDVFNVLRNPWVRDPGRVWEAFGHHLAGFDPRFDTSYYRPVMHLVLAVCSAVAGLRPWAFHLVNLAVHAFVSACVYVLLERWTRPRPVLPGSGDAAASCRPGWAALVGSGPFVGAALFAVHPIHTEPVAWVSGIVELSYAAFLVVGFLAATSDGPRRSVRLAVAPAAYLLALLSKEPAIMLLPIVAVALWARGDLRGADTRRRAAWTLAALGVALLAYLPLRIHALGGLMRGGAARVHVGAVDGTATALGLFAEYAVMMVAPVHLSALHDFRLVPGLLDPRALVGAAAAAAGAGLLWAARRRAGALVGGAFLVLPLLPALYVPVLGDGLAAERYTYVPTIGLALLVACGLEACRRRAAWLLPPVWVGAALLFAASTLASDAREVVWRDDRTLWADAVEKVPDSAAAHEYRGHALLTGGPPDAAVEELQRALELEPTRQDARVNLASALTTVGRVDEAIAAATIAVETRPRSPEAQAVMGYALSARGRFAEAAGAFERAVSLDPLVAGTHNLLAIAYAQLGRREAAAAQFREALRLDPGNAGYAENLALVQR